ncbi:hypothetical protein U9M48_014329 [Paspalum notatum var. saurae]|uniref:Reverse transcriptase domain-containing protein n=1 Tax=Paspalum notatum var. saurae TaxID=547442 RepID=A0AAQ3WKM3_PASNO
MYADDAIIFTRPVRRELDALAALLHRFGEATGLHTNINKSSIVPINCAGLNLDEVLASFPASRTRFPIRYLGIPLTVTRLKKVDFQYLLDKASCKLSSWHGRNLSHAGRLVLVKSVLSAQPVHTLMVANVPREVRVEFDRLRKRFLWAGQENLTGGKCKVNWPSVARPLDLGGLGVLDLDRFARALRLRWLWQHWDAPNAPWAGMEIPCNDTDRLLFAAATEIIIGDGARTSFWHCAWAKGQRPKDIAPDIFAASSKRKLSLREALAEQAWVRSVDIQQIRTVEHLKQFVELWAITQSVSLVQNTEDRIIWNFNASGVYSAVSAYRAQFVGHTSFNLMEALGTFQVQVFRLAHHPKPGLDMLLGGAGRMVCPLCRRQPETAHHLIIECRYSRRIWESMASWLSIAPLAPNSWPVSDSVKQWWFTIGYSPTPRRGMRSALFLVVWQIWLERNARTFQRRGRSVLDLVATIKAEAKLWGIAGAKHLVALMPPVVNL